MDTVSKLLFALVVFLFSSTLFIAYMFALELYAQPMCYENGYYETRVTWNAKMYCVDDVRKTIVPLSELGE